MYGVKSLPLHCHTLAALKRLEVNGSKLCVGREEKISLAGIKRWKLKFCVGIVGRGNPERAERGEEEQMEEEGMWWWVSLIEGRMEKR